MKTITRGLLIVLYGTSVSISLKAQCTPDTTIKIPGFYPASFPDADKDKPYSASTTVLSIKDTTVFGQVVIIDSTVLKAVVGLPTGITYQCLTNNCVFLPSKPSCVNFSGTPTQAGNFPLKMAVMIYAKIGGAIPYNRSDTLRTFSIKVNGINSSEDLENNSQFSVSPNPVENELVVFLAPYSFSKSLWITDAMGRILMVESNNVEGEQIRINTSNLLPGVYFCSNGLISKRFIKL